MSYKYQCKNLSYLLRIYFFITELNLCFTRLLYKEVEMKPPDHLSWFGLLLCPPTIAFLTWLVSTWQVGVWVGGIYSSARVISPAGTLGDGSLCGVANQTFWVWDYSNSSVSQSHTCSTLSYTWNTHTLQWMKSIYGHSGTICPGSFIPLWLPTLCLLVQCWGILFYKGLLLLQPSAGKGGARLLCSLPTDFRFL